MFVMGFSRCWMQEKLSPDITTKNREEEKLSDRSIDEENIIINNDSVCYVRCLSEEAKKYLMRENYWENWHLLRFLFLRFSLKHFFRYFQFQFGPEREVSSLGEFNITFSVSFVYFNLGARESKSLADVQQ